MDVLIMLFVILVLLGLGVLAIVYMLTNTIASIFGRKDKNGRN